MGKGSGKEEGNWIPVTPANSAKPIPARPNAFSASNISQDEYHDYWLRSNSRKITDALETKKAHSYNNRTLSNFYDGLEMGKMLQFQPVAQLRLGHVIDLQPLIQFTTENTGDEDCKHENVELSQPSVGSLSWSASTLSKMKNDQQRCNDHGRDLNKQPRKRPRIGNHRPKVVVEGQPKRTPIPVMPNNAPSKKKLSRKMKNGGKNRPKASDMPSKDVEEKIFDPNQQEAAAARSCRRVLNFNLENVARDETPVKVTSRQSCQIGSVDQPWCNRELKLKRCNDHGRKLPKIGNHRPKVEDVSKRTPKPVTPNLAPSKKKLSRKRENGGKNSPSAADKLSKEVEEKAFNPTQQPAARSCSVMGTEDGLQEMSLKDVIDSVVSGSQEMSLEEVIDSVLQRAECLEISNGGGQLVLRDQYENSTQSGLLTLVPYKVQFDPNKKEHLKPKVELDEETVRVWKLLMEKDGCEAFEEERKDKQKWWEEERELFRGRVASFIARMHLIQGDRHFSPWKGSVVDSVVGVFLTQNVDDTLSSSAFMSLAAQYPHRTVGDVFPSKKFFTSSTGQAMSGTQFSSASTPAANLATKERHYASTSSSNSDDDQSMKLQPAQDMSSTDAKNQLRNRIPLKRKKGVEENVDNKLDSRKKLKRKTDKAEDKEDNKLESRSTLRREREKVKEDKKLESRTNLRREMGKVEEKEDNTVDCDSLRKSFSNGEARDRSSCTLDSLNWSAVRSAKLKEVSKVIQQRGMNNKLARRIKNCLDRIVKDHGGTDLEWLRNVPPEKAKEYLLSIEGLGLKSVECIRLLTLKHISFPVDRNVGRVAVRLGWVPIKPLPEGIQIHLLKQYPMVNSIQKYLWPRLCTLDQGTLYELHYQMITFGKVFCTKREPNCNACPMRGECKHFASEFTSARLALAGPQEKSIACSDISMASLESKAVVTGRASLCFPNTNFSESSHQNKNYTPIIEVPPSLELECTQILERDIEDLFIEEEIPTVGLNTERFIENLQKFMDENNIPLQEGDMSKALVVLTSEASCTPAPVLKNTSRLRTEHQVYVLPDSHPLLERLDKREPGEMCPYLLSIWTPVEGADISEPLEEVRDSHKSKLDNEEFSSPNNTEEQDRETVSGTLLIPCRTAMRGNFPLNGTYFQVNEVFADDESSHHPINVPRAWIWYLARKTLYCGTSVRAILRGLSTEEIQQCFWRGFVCIRGFNRKTRAPMPLAKRFHRKFERIRT